MKWLMLIGITILSSGCVTEVVEYRQVAVAPVVAPVVEPVIVDVDYYPQPLDVTTTAIDFY